MKYFTAFWGRHSKNSYHYKGGPEVWINDRAAFRLQLKGWSSKDRVEYYDMHTAPSCLLNRALWEPDDEA